MSWELLCNLFPSALVNWHSKNCVLAAKVAKALGLKVVALTGNNGGEIKFVNSEYEPDNCIFRDNEPDDVRDVGWYLDPAYHGHGYAKEAAIAMLDFMFNEVEISEIKTSAADCNGASWGIMEKLGFTHTGYYKSTYIQDDKIVICKSYYGNKELFNNRSAKRK